MLVYGARDIASSMPDHASKLYARNVSELLLLLHKGRTADGAGASRTARFPTSSDEIVAGSCVTYAGQIRHEPTAALLDQPGGQP